MIARKENLSGIFYRKLGHGTQWSKGVANGRDRRICVNLSLNFNHSSVMPDYDPASNR
jgi:hypothetical protein